MSQWKKKTV